MDDLKRWEHPHSHSIIKANMIEAEDTLFPFAGLGMDTAVINDYNKVKRSAKQMVQASDERNDWLSLGWLPSHAAQSYGEAGAVRITNKESMHLLLVLLVQKLENPFQLAA